MLRQAKPPLIAVVRLRKGEWVLPKGKLDDGETPRDAAMREVWEETGHDVSVHEFLGTLAYDAGGRPKIVHYWRMETSGRPTRELMHDVSAVDWLPLSAALERLSRDHERAFLANVGPLAVEATRRSRERRQVAPGKSRRRGVAPKSVPAIPPPATALPDGVLSVIEFAPRVIEHDAPDTSAPAIEPGMAEVVDADAIAPGAPAVREDHTGLEAPPPLRITMMRKVRSWLRRVS